MSGLDDFFRFHFVQEGASIISFITFPARLERSHPASRQEPHALILIAAVNDIDVIARHRVVEGGARILGDELKEGVPPRVICVMEDFFADLF